LSRESKYKTEILEYIELHPDLSENAYSKALADVLKVSIATARRHLKQVLPTYEPVEPTVISNDTIIAPAEVIQTSPEVIQISDDDLYDEIRKRLIGVMRTAQYEKDAIMASQTLIKMSGFASAEYQESRKKDKQEKPSMRSIGAAMDAIVLKSSVAEVEKIYGDK